MKKIFTFLALVFLAPLFFSACSLKDNRQPDQNLPLKETTTLSPDLGESCRANSGNWLSDFNECELVNQDWCIQNQGDFNECASACRHNPEAEFCTMQCIPVCSFLDEGAVLKASPLDATYTIEDIAFPLVNGRAKKAIDGGGASKILVSVFEANTLGDIDKDGFEDYVVILTEDAGGSGTFYYVALAMGGLDSYTGTNAIFLGDRIAPQTTEIRDGEIIVNYGDRNPGESFDVEPSLGASKYLFYDNGQLKEK